MPDEEIVNSAPLTLSDGTVVYKGQIYNFDELLDLWEQEAYARQDEAELTRDFRRDDQNLWGRKPKFKDNWMNRKPEQKKRKGYPRDQDL
jgi:hypothetical protein